MSKKLEILDSPSPRGKVALFWCPGCKSRHGFQFGGTEGPQWQFDGNMESPTFTPSYRLSSNEKTLCHLKLKSGRIEFLSDSAHELAGLSVELPDLDAGAQQQ